LHIPNEKQKNKSKQAVDLWTCCWTARSATGREGLYTAGRRTTWACSVYSFGARDRQRVQLQKDIMPQMSSRGRSVMCLELGRWQLLLPWAAQILTSSSSGYDISIRSGLLAIPEPFRKTYVNAEYGQEMCFHNLLFFLVHCFPGLTFNLQVL